MDLFAALGISRTTGLLAAGVGLAVAAVMALARARRSARDASAHVRLNDRD
jgi:hypothetical protein